MLENLLAAFRSLLGRPTPTATRGEMGTVINGGYIQTIEKNPQLTGRARYKTFSDILANTTIVAAGTRYFLNLIAAAGWSVKPPKDSGEEGERLAELTEKILTDMSTPWPRIVRRAAMYKFYGFSIQEWTAKLRDDGVIGFKDIEARPQITIERWVTDNHGTVFGVLQRSEKHGYEIPLPREKLVYMVDDALTDSPEGLGLFRHLVDTARQLTELERLEGTGFETDLRGIPVGKAPMAELQTQVEQGKISSAKAKELLQTMITFLENHVKTTSLGIMLDSKHYESKDAAATPSAVPQWAVELLQGGDMSLEEVANAIERKNREMARVLGVDQLLLGSDSRGSHALSQDKTSAFFLVVNSALTELANAFEADLIGPLWELNGWAEELKPTLNPEIVKFRDVEQIAKVLQLLGTAGAIVSPLDPAINEIRTLLGLSPQDQEEIEAEQEERRQTLNRQMENVVNRPDTDTDTDPEPQE